MCPKLDGFILAAGLGTRMGPLSAVLPKPLWPLQGLPLLHWVARAMQGSGLTHLGCNAHHLGWLLEAATWPGLRTFQEPLLMGSAGGLRHALAGAKDPLAVWNGDALGEVPWSAFLAEHQRRGAELSWLLVPHPGGPWNAVYLDPSGRVLPQGKQGLGPFHFTGASAWSEAALAKIPSEPCDVKRDILPRLTHHAGIVVEAFPWLEVGTPDQLIEAARQLAPGLEGRVPGCYIHPSAEASCQLKRCILGPGAKLPPAFQDQDAFWFEDQGRLVRLALPRAPGGE